MHQYQSQGFQHLGDKDPFLILEGKKKVKGREQLNEIYRIKINK